ncbi:DNA gyrase/topoisomerase IV subunit B [Actinotignum sanguinis]|uniref:DNA topoisomerase (ATP-hydrolyzing) n=2 Tax=Actinomycetaceae TaxID=2049 RepID=A0ABZ0RDD9_9ACTO|nr:DNA topoisomerase IV subunit B [Actinotignum sanguinis]WPJ89524.1 DNA topoisomerase IV subunit B [Schaalia turicensis]MDE1553371.1 DNA topoisomerase IV subunit B [Actinotignum sanguinis]MDE1565718.1 DNA topoisomerase IV subunit B [Actinotignum sanguinis]MDE1577833.1 DNA topoisomerase IV subunit B [Actinotignum sanguinis]MDE1642437.1 DNA topoisomerase IV subunit B [Actinotignum sanguinis]
MSTSEEYSARHLQVLEGLEAVRKRPGMYIGSTDSRGLMHCLWEIIDNGIDEALEGFATHITVTLYADGSVEVTDDGRGVPVDTVPGVGLSGVEVVYTRLHAGGKFGGGSYSASGGLHGVGASVVNALSARMDVKVRRGGKVYQMQFKRGEPGRFQDGTQPSPEAPFEAFTHGSELDTVGKVAKKNTGTSVRYWADPQIFLAEAEFSYDLLTERVRQSAFLVPGLTITIRDERGLAGTPGENGPHEEVFHYEGGVVDFVDYLATDPALTATMHLTGSETFTENVQVLDPESGHLRAQEVERTCEVDVALRWGTGYDTTTESFVNIIRTPGGGAHQTGFEQGVVKTLRALIDTNARRLKITAKDAKIEKDDILAGMTAVVTVRLAEPQFEGQTKEILGTAAVRPIVARVVAAQLHSILASTKRDQKTETSRLLEKIVAEMRARVAARVHKEISRRKNALENSTLPAKLADCRSDDIEHTELFIVEGDSALGTAKLARSSEFQALLPIRGKILNVQRASPADILRNQEVSSIIQVVGAGSGRTFDLAAARYGKIIMMTDADVDGAHIRTLLLTLFFRYMRPLVEAGRVFAAVPPLHRIEVAGRGGKKGSYIYTYSEEELHRELKKLERAGKTYKEPIQRYKGLGEMDAHQLAETTMDPAHRTLRRIRIEDEAALREAESVFEVLMGNEVAPRREFIVEGASDISYDKIDA